METIYIVGIVAGVIGVVIIIVVWLLRDRITGGRFRGSVPQQEIEVEVKAAPPRRSSGDSIPPTSAPHSSASVDISGNWLIGGNTIRIFRDKVRFSFNRLFGRNRLDVGSELPPTAVKPKKRGQKK